MGVSPNGVKIGRLCQAGLRLAVGAFHRTLGVYEIFEHNGVTGLMGHEIYQIYP
jgi:hypothetical protein